MNSLPFAEQQYLALGLIVGLALTAFFYWSWRVKQKLIRQFISPRLLGGLMLGVSHRREKARLALTLAGVVFLFLALARPQWGFVWQEAHQQGLDILVAIDTSRSMLAQDVAPNRLERAKLAALDLMRLAQSDRLGLVAFAGTAFLQSPLTLDDEAFRQSVDALNTSIIPQGGTALSAAIRTAMESFEKGNDNHKVIILMTDGEDHDIDTETAAAAKEAAEAGVKIFTIGVGTPAGELLRVADGPSNTSFIKDEQGNVVKSHLNQALLQQIATTAGGFYLPLQGADPMKTLYDRGLAPLPKGSSTTKLTRVFEERFHWFLAAAILCLALETVLPESTTSRRRQTKPASAVAVTVAALVLFLTARSAKASPSTAYSDYRHGKYDQSLEEYSRLADKKTNDYRLHYDAGSAAYQTKDYAKALQQFNTTLEAPDVISDTNTQEHAHYNLGNTFYRIGEPLSDPEKKQGQWEQALKEYSMALGLNTNDIDAKNNLAYVKEKLEQLKQQQQQQQKQQKQDDKKKDQKKDQQQQNQDDKDKKDQDKKDQKDQKQDSQDQKDKQQQQQDKQEQAKNDQQKQDEQKKKDQQQQQQQAQQDKEKKEQEAQANQSDQREQGQTNGPGMMMAQMTPQQARQLLDAQKDDEQALIFQPTNMPTPPPNVRLKDW